MWPSEMVLFVVATGLLLTRILKFLLLMGPFYKPSAKAAMLEHSSTGSIPAPFPCSGQTRRVLVFLSWLGDGGLGFFSADLLLMPGAAVTHIPVACKERELHRLLLPVSSEDTLHPPHGLGSGFFGERVEAGWRLAGNWYTQPPLPPRLFPNILCMPSV